jgi:dienelactone hydrolase
VLALALAAPAAAPLPQAADGPSFETVFYDSGKLRIQAYLYKPEGTGPFPLVIYNHGSRVGRERTPVPFRYVGGLLTKRGFGVLVPERRGYGQSDGPTFQEEVGRDRGPSMIARLQAETGDVLAALDYLKTLPWVDQQRLGIMGWSFGGMVTLFATNRSDRFKAAVNQAGGALTWPISEAVRDALKDAARKTRTPLLLMVAKNDRTTESVTALAKILEERGAPHKLIVYDAFTPTPAAADDTAPGHALFSVQGYKVWQDDVTGFLAERLR